MKKNLTLALAVFLPLAAWAQPLPIWRNFFTTNPAVKILPADGTMNISSNPATGVYSLSANLAGGSATNALSTIRTNGTSLLNPAFALNFVPSDTVKLASTNRASTNDIQFNAVSAPVVTAAILTNQVLAPNIINSNTVALTNQGNTISGNGAGLTNLPAQISPISINGAPFITRPSAITFNTSNVNITLGYLSNNGAAAVYFALNTNLVVGGIQATGLVGNGYGVTNIAGPIYNAARDEWFGYDAFGEFYVNNYLGLLFSSAATKINFTDTPTVNGVPVITNATATGQFIANQGGFGTNATINGLTNKGPFLFNSVMASSASDQYAVTVVGSGGLAVRYRWMILNDQGIFLNTNVVLSASISTNVTIVQSLTNLGNIYNPLLTASKLAVIGANNELTNSSLDFTNVTPLTYAAGVSNLIVGGSATNAIGSLNGLGTNTTIVSGKSLESTNIVGTNGYFQSLTINTQMTDQFFTGSLTVSNGSTFNGITNTGVYVGNNGTWSNAVLSTSASASNSPAANEFPTAQWVRGLFNNGLLLYAGTNVSLVATNTDETNIVHNFQTTIPNTATRTYPVVTNGEYIGSVVTTNTFTFLQGPIDVNSYLYHTNGTGGPTVSVHPEIYYSYDRTNWYGDYTAANQTLTTTLALYQWVVSFPSITATNANGFYIQRRFKIGTATGATHADVVVNLGTNLVSGVNNAAHIALSGPSSAAGNAFLANNQIFTGTNTFTAPIQGNGGGLTNIPGQVGYYSANGAPFFTNGTALVFDGVNDNLSVISAVSGNSGILYFMLTNRLGASGALWSVNSTNIDGGTISANNVKVTNNVAYVIRTTNDLAGAQSNIVVSVNSSTLDVTVTNNITLTNWTGLADGFSFNKLIRLNVTTGGPWAVLYPTDGASYGLFWRTNCPPQANRPYTSVTNGSTYLLSITTMGSNVMASMTEWK